MTQYTSQMFQEEKFWYKKCYANDNKDSRINDACKIGGVVWCKIRSVRVIHCK